MTTTFQDLGISDRIIQSLLVKGYEFPTPIQIQTIPLFLSGDCNIIGQAQTGSGKTAAFGVPIIQNIKEKTGHIQAIILTPTRELAIQVSDEMSSFGGMNGLKIVPVFGGQPIPIQLRALAGGADIIVGTPGRVIDLMHRKRLDLSHISYFVLDEADEMLNMGFIDDIKEIIQHTNDDKRMLCFSATMPKPILGIAKKYMGQYEMVSVEKIKESVLIEQLSIDVSPALKFEALCRVIDSDPDFYGLVFCARKDTSDEVVQKLEERGYDADVIHGDILQEQRIRIMDRFRKQKLRILVATDVAARGIDVNELTHVVNYDIPQDPESYTHRIGRTGRAGKAGIAITLLTPADFRKFAFIKKMANADVRRVQLPDADQVAAMKREKLYHDLSLVIQSDFVHTERAEPFIEFAQMLVTEDRTAEDVVTCLLQHVYENRILPRADDKIIDEMFAQIQKANFSGDVQKRRFNDKKDDGKGRRNDGGYKGKKEGGKYEDRKGGSGGNGGKYKNNSGSKGGKKYGGKDSHNKDYAMKRLENKKYKSRD
ncbi:DEAD-box ATP-dependent RNA helicase CshA [Methanimicrococcus sp. At1]|uniref:RNA helicase n=1 Tax=Methanimicrococcus hacksteinii TaxID=3028293 RepID=A0ABU3VNH3_9EURY|nr:DEAD/DEAH box helicase [Methanimicrococcus sp. At1]MDV0444879.1 DEAD-box ATP-dependent RNA helicase CshA [Methanimicrococcus sp. At1]